MKCTDLTTLLLLLILSLTGCINEDNSHCRQNVVFRYQYIFNKDNKDLFAEQVKSVDLFIYNSQGDLVKRVPHHQAGNSITVSDLPNGRYRAVSWANFTDEYYAIEDASTMEGNLLTIKAEEGTIKNFNASLFHHFAEFEVDAAEPTTVDASLIKNTNKIMITITDPIGSQALGNLSFSIKGSNSSYKYNNSLVENQPTIRYSPFSVQIDENLNKHEFNIARLFLGDDLSIEVFLDGALVKSIPLVSTLVSNSTILNTNDDLDRYDEYELTYNLSSNNTLVLTSIRINDWTKIIHNGGI